MFGNPKAKAISALAVALEKLVAVRREELAWLRSNAVTKQDLKQLEENMAIKVNELEGTVGKLDAKVTKIWGEQQKRYDELVVAFEEVKKQLENVEVPAAAETVINAFEAKLNAFDDQIPDTTA